MPDLSWIARGDMDRGRTYLVMASYLPLASITATIPFVRAVAAIRKQLRTADGLVGYTLRARPLSCDYWTLSVWSDQAALQQFMRTAPHVGVMGALKPVMGPAKFVRWEITAADGQPSWTDALERLDRQ